MLEPLDLRGTLCPLNFVYTKLRLEELAEGEELEVIIDDGEPIRNVPRSLKQEGHKVLSMERLEDSCFKLRIRRGRD